MEYAASWIHGNSVIEMYSVKCIAIDDELLIKTNRYNKEGYGKGRYLT